VQVHILHDYPGWSTWLDPLVIAGTVLAAVGLVLLHLRHSMRGGVAAAVVGVLALLTPAAAFAQDTMQHTATGNIIRAGPSASSSSSPFGGNGTHGTFTGAPPSGTGSSTSTGSSRPAFRFGQFSAKSGTPPFGRAGQGVMGGAGGGGAVSSTLITYLEQHRGSAKYIVATTNSSTAAPIIIATGMPVMSLGGFSGSDPILTTSGLAALAKAGEIRYFLTGGGGGGSSLMSWIQAHSKVITVGGTQLYEYTG
jgi:4-amino-4-deoxy-L-arabinose transferase-like glycosyltransferase